MWDLRNDVDKVQVNYPAVSAILAGDASPGIIFSSLCQLCFLSLFEFTNSTKHETDFNLFVSFVVSYFAVEKWKQDDYKKFQNISSRYYQNMYWYIYTLFIL